MELSFKLSGILLFFLSSPLSLFHCFFYKLLVLLFQLSPVFLQKALSALNENVLPHLQNPCLMTDFLSNAYNKGIHLFYISLLFLFKTKC